MKKRAMQWKNSIRIQLAGIFIIMLLVIVGASFLMNLVFLQDFYVSNKLSEIQYTYIEMNQLFKDNEPGTQDFDMAFARLHSSKDLSIVVADSGMNIICSSEKEANMMASRLLWKVISGDTDNEPGNDQRTDEIPPPPDDMYGNSGSLSDNRGDDGRGFERMEEEVLATTEVYTVTSSSDPAMRTDFIELWGYLDNGDLIFIRSPMASIRESAYISNKFLLIIGLIIAVIGMVIMWFVSKRITEPLLELTEISDRMAHMDFEARYKSGGNNEIAELGEHMNEMSMKLEKSVSDLKSANAELQRDIEKKDKLESMRSEFISNVSHELKTPIAIVEGYAEGIRDGIADDEASRNEYLGIIIDESQKMGRMVNNLLELNHLEFGDEPLEVTRFDVMELMKDMINSSDILVRQKDVKVELVGEDPVYVWSDEAKVGTVFINFLSNAIRYCGDEKRVEVTTERNGDNVRIQVFNTGDPIPEESIDRLWDKFYKVDKARTREAGGSGVGLSIVKAIMETLNKSYGVINYDNGVGFWFELDADKAE